MSKIVYNEKSNTYSLVFKGKYVSSYDTLVDAVKANNIIMSYYVG